MKRFMVCLLSVKVFLLSFSAVAAKKPVKLSVSIAQRPVCRKIV